MPRGVYDRHKKVPTLSSAAPAYAEAIPVERPKEIYMQLAALRESTALLDKKLGELEIRLEPLSSNGTKESNHTDVSANTEFGKALAETISHINTLALRVDHDLHCLEV